MGDNKKGPWGSNDDSNKSPWGETPRGQSGGKGGYNPDGPNLDDMLKEAQDRFGKMFSGGNGSSPSSKGSIGILLIILLILWGITGFYRVLPEEHGVILTFGKWTDTKTSPGLKYHAPWPIQAVQKVNVTFERRIQVGFTDKTSSRRFNRSTNEIGSLNDVPAESLMVTGDENIIDIDFVATWQISDAGKYLFEIRNPEQTIKKVAESAMREIIGRTPIQPALTEARGDIQVKTRELMQHMLDAYNSGVNINEVQLQKVDPPSQVVDAFDDVQRARADKERLRNEAETYRNDIIPIARGEAEKLKQEAEAYKQSVINIATGDAERFLSVYKAYSVSKDVTRTRMYIETMQKILSKSNKVIIDNDKDGMGVMPYLPLDQFKKQAR